MSHNFKKLNIIIISLLLTSCISSYHVKDLEQVVTSSPKIEQIASKKFDPRTNPDEIKIFFREWNPLTKPDAIRDWETIFIMGEGSSPDWEFTEISQVVIALRRKNDNKAIAEIKKIANKQGGDAVLDLHREPMIDGPKVGSRIIGYRYYGSVIRKN